jgi:hypothetical protein
VACADSSDTEPFCETIALADGNTLKSAGWLGFSNNPSAENGIALLTDGSMDIRLPNSVTRVTITGAMDPSYGTYKASIATTVNPNTIKGAFGRPVARDVLYYDTTLPAGSQGIKLEAAGTVGLQNVRICYTS